MRFLTTLALCLLVPSLYAQIEVGTPTPLTTPEDGFAHARFSPNGRYVAFTTPSYNGLWVRDLTTGSDTQITDAPGAGFGASWSPDGAALLARVAQVTENGRQSAVAVYDVAAGELQLLTEYRVRMAGVPAWSAGGAEAIVPGAGEIETLPTGRSAVAGKATAAPLVALGDALYAAGSAAPRVRPVAGRAVLNVVPSPDGTRYAFEVMGEGLFVVDADGSNLLNLGEGEHPTWSPDGQWIAFMRVEDDGHELTGGDLYAVPAAGGAPIALTRTEGRIELFPTWTPDGAAIAFDAADEGRVYLLPVRY